MFPNEKTVYIGRVADQPSSTGSYIYNTLYRELGQNAIYLQFSSTDSASFVAGLRALGFRGCTVVASHAKGVLPHIDDLDPHARKVGAINTLVNEEGVWRGYKTDGPALVDSLREVTTLSAKRIVVLGAGKLVREISFVLPNEGVAEVTVYNRTIDKGKRLSQDVGFRFGGGLDDLPDADGDIFINATDIGAMWCDTKDVFPEEFVAKFDVVLDVTFKPFSSPLQEKAAKLGKKVVPGWRMFAHQGARQVKLYLGVDPSLDRLCELIKEEFS